MNLCIATVVNRQYMDYFNMWIYCIQNEYPEYADFARIWDADFESIKKYPDDPNTVAAYRFTGLEDALERYDAVLLTDIDILHYREPKPILQYHLDNIKRWKTECYDNFQSTAGKMPGVHFITKDWWDQTRIARKMADDRLKTEKIGWGEDESILFNIVRESGLPISSRRGPGTCHGLHLGAFRETWNRSDCFNNLSALDSLFIEKLAGDKKFMDIINQVPATSKPLYQILNKLWPINRR